LYKACRKVKKGKRSERGLKGNSLKTHIGSGRAGEGKRYAKKKVGGQNFAGFGKGKKKIQEVRDMKQETRRIEDSRQVVAKRGKKGAAVKWAPSTGLSNTTRGQSGRNSSTHEREIIINHPEED